MPAQIVRPDNTVTIGAWLQTGATNATAHLVIDDPVVQPTLPDTGSGDRLKGTVGASPVFGLADPTPRASNERYTAARLWVCARRVAASLLASLTDASGVLLATSITSTPLNTPDWQSVDWSIPSGTPDSYINGLRVQFDLDAGAGPEVYAAYVELFVGYRNPQRMVL